jgi:hypothetical protein
VTLARVLVAASLVALLARLAHAEEDTAVAAREAFLRGTELARAERWGEALAAYEASAAIRSHPVTTYNLGFCERALSRFTRARMRFLMALAEHDDGSTGELPESLRESARAYLADAEAALARVNVTLFPEDSVVSVDGAPLAVESDGLLVAGTLPAGAGEVPPAAHFVVLVDPGTRRFLVERAGVPDVVLERRFEAGSHTELLLRAGEAPPIPIAPAPRRAPTPIRRVTADGMDLTVPAALLLGAGAAGLTSASVLGLVYALNDRDLSEACIEGLCPSDRGEQIALTNGVGTAALVTLGLGVVAIGAGIVLLAVDSSDADDAATGTRFELWVGPSRLGLHAAF